MKYYKYYYSCRIDNNSEISYDKIIRSNNKNLMRKYITNYKHKMFSADGCLYSYYFKRCETLMIDGREANVDEFINW